MGNAASSVACTIACPAILDAPRPLCTMRCVAARTAPLAHGGGLAASNAVKSCSNCPCTVACVLGCAVAA